MPEELSSNYKKNGGEKILLHYYNICNTLQRFINRQIEKTAFAELMNYLENRVNNEVKEIALQSLDERNKINIKREQQSRYTKKRIDQECMKKAIDIINQKHLSSTLNTEGKAEDKERAEEYSKMINFVDRLEQDE